MPTDNGSFKNYSQWRQALQREKDRVRYAARASMPAVGRSVRDLMRARIVLGSEPAVVRGVGGCVVAVMGGFRGSAFRKDIRRIRARGLNRPARRVSIRTWTVYAFMDIWRKFGVG